MGNLLSGIPYSQASISAMVAWRRCSGDQDQENETGVTGTCRSTKTSQESMYDDVR